MGKIRSKKVLISGYIGFSNFGDDVMLRVLVDRLKMHNCSITALSSNVEDTEKTFEIKALPYKNLLSILRGILMSDVVVMGGGNLLQNETSEFNPFYYLFIMFLAKLFFKKLVIFSQGIGPLRGNFTLYCCKNMLKHADLIIVRDIYSQRILSKWKINSKYPYDAFWDIPLPPSNPQKIIGMQLRDFSNFRIGFFDDLAKYINLYFSDYQINIFSFQNDSDLPVCYKLQKAILKRNPRAKTSILPYKSIQDVLENISKLDYMIAMRLHANITALRARVKILPIAYSGKVEIFAKEFKLPYFKPKDSHNINALVTDLISSEQKNERIDFALNKSFDWKFFDEFILK